MRRDTTDTTDDQDDPCDRERKAHLWRVHPGCGLEWCLGTSPAPNETPDDPYAQRARHNLQVRG